MDFLTIVVVVSVVIVALVAYSMYSSLIKGKNEVEETLSSIDIYLRKRVDTIPNLLKIAKNFMQNEKELLQQVTQAREGLSGARASGTDAAGVEQAMEADNQFTRAFGMFQARVEAYPELKSDTMFSQAMSEMVEVEEDIAAARRIYNMSTKDINIKIEMFPSSVIAGMLGLKKYPYYKDPEKDRISQSIDASSYL